MTELSLAPAKRVRVRYSNHGKVLLCYLFCFAAPPLWLLCGLWLVYPYRLVGSAPLVCQNLLSAFPFLDATLSPLAALSADPTDHAAGAWAEALLHRDRQWMVFLLAVFALAWLITLIWQLVWRGASARPVNASKNVFRAIRRYRLTMLALWLVNLAAAALVWLLGARFIQGRTLWDYLVYFVPYALNGVAALFCCRLAAPPSLSGKRAFFKRL